MNPQEIYDSVEAYEFTTYVCSDQETQFESSQAAQIFNMLLACTQDEANVNFKLFADVLRYASASEGWE